MFTWLVIEILWTIRFQENTTFPPSTRSFQNRISHEKALFTCYWLVIGRHYSAWTNVLRSGSNALLSVSFYWREQHQLGERWREQRYNSSGIRLLLFWNYLFSCYNFLQWVHKFRYFTGKYGFAMDYQCASSEWSSPAKCYYGAVARYQPWCILWGN